MDDDVKAFLLGLLNNTPLEVRGPDAANLADLYARAVAQIGDLTPEGEQE